MISEQDGRALVERVGQQFPALLRTNTNASCFQFVGEVLKALHAAGHTDWGYVGKTGGEGQYQPPTGFPMQVGPHRLTGVSHDAIASPTQRIDTLGSGNDSDKPIYHKSTEPFWSFDPTDGPRIYAVPSWTDIPPEHWRPNNPIVAYPLSGSVPTPGPSPQPPTGCVFPPRNEGLDFFTALNTKYKVHGEPATEYFVNVEGTAVWYAEYLRYRTTGLSHTAAQAAVFAAIDKIWNP